ncbi:MAG: hypothetical protein AB4352_08515 [Hormoscilla sp.]
MNNPLNGKQHMPNVTASSQVMSNGAKNYAPSVPISVYRELAEQMQANQKRVEFLKAENQQLTRQNQQLRQEIQKLVSSAIYLQQVANSFEPAAGPPIGQKTEPVPPPNGSAPGPPAATELLLGPAAPEASAPKDKTLLTEREEGRYRRPEPPEAASEVSGIWLAVAIFLIVIFAFGAGFLIVRPLSKGR